MRREVYKRVGGMDPTVLHANDYDFCLKASEIAEIRHLPKPLYFYRVHEQTISHQSRINQIEGSQRAVAAALKRRGMDDEYRVDVEIFGKFYLRKKRPT
jgi:GT2 family glycosyltransferase